jgi:hypothetical protein
MRIGETISEADQRRYADFLRRSETSPLCRLVREAAAAGDAYRAAAQHAPIRDVAPAPVKPIPLVSRWRPSLA